jgi:hypothetical protein
MLGRHADAHESYAAAAQVARLGANDLYNFGICANEIGRYADAVAHYRAAAALAPREARIHNNLGKSLNRLGRYAEAEAALRRALDLEPGRPASELNLAVNLLARGDWKASWPLFEARLRAFDVIAPMPYPAWDGQVRRDRLLLLRTEQGLGDAIQFARFASDLGRAGQAVIIQTDARMVALLKTAPKVLDVIAYEKSLRSERHPIEWAPLLSVPGRLGITPANLPRQGPYLAADAARVARWRAWLPQAGLRIGIGWQGNPAGEIDRGRSFALDHLAGIADLPGVHLIALQKGAGLEQVKAVAFGNRITLPGPDFDTGSSAFLDTAALMMSLDLVITSDTALAHLAGALGRPTFLALQRWPDWRWLLDRDDTPWCPTLRLFRQADPGDWAGVFERMTAAVQDMKR